MTTLSRLIREIFAVRRNDPMEKLPPEEAEESEKESDQTTVTNQNQNEDETENHEDPGDNQLAAADSPEDYGNASQGTGQPGSGKEGLETEEKTLSRKDLEEAVKKAYNEGLVDGRNQTIEERYFPKKEDALPNFRGTPPKNRSFGGIFSIAREA